MGKTQPVTVVEEFEEIRAREEQAEVDRRRVLERLGWKYTSSTPGCYWMYEKTVDGRVLLVNADVAERIETEAAYARGEYPEYADDAG